MTEPKKPGIRRSTWQEGSASSMSLEQDRAHGFSQLKAVCLIHYAGIQE